MKIDKRIDKEVLDGLSLQAVESPRLRMNLDMRNSTDDQSQRMLNALEPGTVLPIHRHRSTSETCIVVRGRAEEIFYDGDGNETERVLMEAGTDCCGVNIPKGVWHKIEALLPGTVIFEAKDGAYEPITAEDILNLE